MSRGEGTSAGPHSTDPGPRQLARDESAVLCGVALASKLKYVPPFVSAAVVRSSPRRSERQQAHSAHIHNNLGPYLVHSQYTPNSCPARFAAALFTAGVLREAATTSSTAHASRYQRARPRALS